MDGYFSRMKKKMKVRAAVFMTTKYIQLMPVGNGLVSYWWESNAEGSCNSFASGWMFRLFEEVILGALCGSHGRWI
jgi:hypothetical protein